MREAVGLIITFSSFKKHCKKTYIQIATSDLKKECVDRTHSKYSIQMTERQVYFKKWTEPCGTNRKIAIFLHSHHWRLNRGRRETLVGGIGYPNLAKDINILSNPKAG